MPSSVLLGSSYLGPLSDMTGGSFRHVVIRTGKPGNNRLLSSSRTLRLTRLGILQLIVWSAAYWFPSDYSQPQALVAISPELNTRLMRPVWASSTVGFPQKEVAPRDLLWRRTRLPFAPLGGTRTHKLQRTTAFVPSGQSVTELPATGSGSCTHILFGQGQGTYASRPSL